jgi:hypothetical protein
MSFELTGDNHDRVVANYKLAEQHIADRARIIAQKISELRVSAAMNREP